MRAVAALAILAVLAAAPSLGWPVHGGEPQIAAPPLLVSPTSRPPLPRHLHPHAANPAPRSNATTVDLDTSQPVAAKPSDAQSAESRRRAALRGAGEIEPTTTGTFPLRTIASSTLPAQHATAATATETATFPSASTSPLHAASSTTTGKALDPLASAEGKVVNALTGGGADSNTTTEAISALEKLHEAVNTLRATNWTMLVAELRDPQGQAYLSGVGMVVSLVICFFGNRSLWLWLSLSGFLAGFLSVYLLAPAIIDTEFCCGEGTEEHLVLVSVSVGIIGVVAALWALKMGLALAGGGAGFGLAMGLRPSLARLHVLRTDTDFVILCGCLAAAGAGMALLKPKPLIVLATSLAGSFGFVAGLSFFLDCRFASVVVAAEQSYVHSNDKSNGGSSSTPGSGLSTCNIVLLSVWVGLAILGMVVQYRSPRWCRRQKKQPKNSTDSEDEGEAANTSNNNNNNNNNNNGSNASGGQAQGGASGVVEGASAAAGRGGSRDSGLGKSSRGASAAGSGRKSTGRGVGDGGGAEGEMEEGGMRGWGNSSGSGVRGGERHRRRHHHQRSLDVHDDDNNINDHEDDRRPFLSSARGSSRDSSSAGVGRGEGRGSGRGSMRAAGNGARRFVKQRLAEVLAEARRLRLDLASSSDSGASDADLPQQQQQHGRSRVRGASSGRRQGGSKCWRGQRYDALSDESSSEEGPAIAMAPLGTSAARAGAGGGGARGGAVGGPRAGAATAGAVVMAKGSGGVGGGEEMGEVREEKMIGSTTV